MKKIEDLQKNLEQTLRQANNTDRPKSDRQNNENNSSVPESSLQLASMMTEHPINKDDRRPMANQSQFKDHALIKNCKDVKAPIVSESPLIQIGTVREMNAALQAT